MSCWACCPRLAGFIWLAKEVPSSPCCHHFPQGQVLAVKTAPSLPQGWGRTIIEAPCGVLAQGELLINVHPFYPARFLQLNIVRANKRAVAHFTQKHPRCTLARDFHLRFPQNRTL